MADLEGAIYDSLPSTQRGPLVKYATKKLRPVAKAALEALPTIGIAKFGDDDKKVLIAYLQGKSIHIAKDTRYCHAGGFIVSHRRCCCPDVGNGVTVGGWECEDHVTSESCYPCRKRGKDYQEGATRRRRSRNA